MMALIAIDCKRVISPMAIPQSIPKPWRTTLSQTGITAVAFGGVLFYRVPAKVLTSVRNATPHQTAEKQEASSYDVLIIAASRLSRSGPNAPSAANRKYWKYE
jgi:hypothetical protein